MRKINGITETLRRPFRRHSKIGQAPGSVIYLGKRKEGKFQVTLTYYSEGEYSEKVTEEKFVMPPEKGIPNGVRWYNVKGLFETKQVEAMGRSFGLNPLTLEDIVNTDQRPKVDHFDNYLFVVIKMIYLDPSGNINVEHVALVLLESEVLLFQEVEKDVFDGVRVRLRNAYGRIRQRSADYLLFALLDAVVDEYFLVIEHLGNKVEDLEEKVYNHPKPETVHEIQALKKEVLELRKNIRPVKELISQLINLEHPLIKDETKPFLRDIQDHCNQIQDSIDLYREMTMSLMEMYMSSMSNKMNEVMKVLTIMASIFIPLTFIAGIYGMNFTYMPELQHPLGYPLVLTVMGVLVVGMLIYFRKKRWL
ncbi:magnesium/cobalt transporter CorA [Robertkochia sediminum]|uniref:magnesium/cobalt transporter CorA n=1 Tax=Robertkochia sediminum TaxID=2785326 RepID=UPI001932226B|nr:magnesium/cobalt transporter CorA [Robertkochia sediminum]MBL7473540.1 magnesium/cobalt transporter CorA [Robertkochia sediminum]